MFDIQVASQPATGSAIALPVARVPQADVGTIVATSGVVPCDLAEVSAFLDDVEHSGAAGTLHSLPRPGRSPRVMLGFGIGDGDAAGWRAAGAAICRAAGREPEVSIALPDDLAGDRVAALAEGLWLAGYRYRLADDPDATSARRLERVTLIAGRGPDQPGTISQALSRAHTLATGVWLARDLTNTPSDRKSPQWLAERIASAAGEVQGLAAEVWDERRLAAEDFRAVLAVARGSARPPRLVRLGWEPPEPKAHVILVGKGITFDTGGISIKSRDSMKLMRKDMGGAAAVAAATWCAASLRLPVRVTTLVPLAENAVGSDSMRPGDVVRHRGGLTTEIINTDAEGRLVLADALRYAADLQPADAVIDLATLTGAQNIALGKRTAALFTENDELAAAIATASVAAGESVWRLPLPDDYLSALNTSVADLTNVTLGSDEPGAGAVTAALYLREFTGGARSGWAHLDMSAPAWSDSAAGELAKGATGWGVRTLVNLLEAMAGPGQTTP